MTTYAKEVIGVPVNEFDIATVGNSLKHRQTDRSVDLINRIGLASRLEEAFDIALHDDSIGDLRTVCDAIQSVGTIVGQRAL